MTGYETHAHGAKPYGEPVYFKTPTPGRPMRHQHGQRRRCSSVPPPPDSPAGTTAAVIDVPYLNGGSGEEPPQATAIGRGVLWVRGQAEQRQDLRSGRRDRDRVPEVCGRRAVLGGHGPAIRLHHDVAFAHREDRLDRQRHPRAKHEIRLWGRWVGVVKHVRLLDESPADPVADELADDAVA